MSNCGEQRKGRSWADRRLVGRPYPRSCRHTAGVHGRVDHLAALNLPRLRERLELRRRMLKAFEEADAPSSVSPRAERGRL